MNKLPFLVYIISIYLILLIQVKHGNEFFHEEKSDIELCKRDENCRLPNCNCDTTDVPFFYSEDFKLFQLPQLVILTIDDEALDLKSYQIYKKLLEKFKNPNNCSVKATFFISDTSNQTSFCLLRNLYERKHEIAISTVNYSCPNKRCSTDRYFQPWDYSMWSNQILNMRSRINRYAGIPRSQINGFRAPILEPAADMHYRIIAANKFLYDSSLIMNTDDILWPFTLGYSLMSPLSNNGPINFYPGLWELPVQTYIDLNNNREFCLKLWQGHCKYEPTAAGVFKFIRHHFLRSYYKNRAPIVLHMNADWLKQSVTIVKNEIIPDVGYGKKQKTQIPIEVKKYYNLDGLIRFINETTHNNKDVYFVTGQQAIAWLKLLPRLEEHERQVQRKIENIKKGIKVATSEEEEIKNFNLNDLINEMFIDQGKCSEADSIYDGSCAILKQQTPDYYMEDETFDLDDNYDLLLKKKLKIEHKSKMNVLAQLQSEILFINEFVILFIVSLILLLLVIIIRDKFFS